MINNQDQRSSYQFHSCTLCINHPVVPIFSLIVTSIRFQLILYAVSVLSTPEKLPQRPQLQLILKSRKIVNTRQNKYCIDPNGIRINNADYSIGFGSILITIKKTEKPSKHIKRQIIIATLATMKLEQLVIYDKYNHRQKLCNSLSPTENKFCFFLGFSRGKHRCY